MTAADRETLSHAAALLDGEALSLRLSHAKGERNDDWTGEERALSFYNDMRATAIRLYDIAGVV